MQHVQTIARRELREIFTDWRVIMPMAILALLFPWALLVGGRYGLRLLEQGQDFNLLLPRMIALGALAVGFFPSSFSLVVALESFVGEKERNTLETLLATPVSDRHLFFGKLLAVLVLPISFSYLALAIFLSGVVLLYSYTIPVEAVLLVLLLTPAKAASMVCAGVVVSSTTNTVRAANLLASFIILPMSIVVQIESMLIIQARYDILLLMLLGLIVTCMLTIRWGLSVFNREEIMARESANPITALKEVLARSMRNIPQQPRSGSIPASDVPFSLGRVYSIDIPILLRRYRGVMMVILGSYFFCALVAFIFTLKSNPDRAGWLLTWKTNILQNAALSPVLLRAGDILLSDIVVTTSILIISPLTMGVFAMIWIMMEGLTLGHSAALATSVTGNPFAYLAAMYLPVGILRTIGYMLLAVYMIPVSAALLNPPKGTGAIENALVRFVDLLKMLLVIVPLFVLAAAFEATLQPALVHFFYP